MPWYTVDITIHRAQHVPVGDIHKVSSDPYVCVTLYPQNLNQGKLDDSLGTGCGIPYSHTQE
ncbi:hypothetical protein BDM02DRAFT_3108407 [Thelephora ganbajun]|uniref:Uncharacterized protein n=1 Tax=Thelephora ganbajun TaxID=370292 RepID=A0ACB6ZV76_THEGA|nr:hypothetical protein BDM02DRAFT_3108407 [Thelephora ganbajun]